MSARLLLLDCYLETPGASRNFERLLPKLNMQVIRPAHAAWRVRADEFDAIIISGSAASIVTPPDWVRPLEQLVREAAAADVPTLGVCFGHQVIARALFGPEAVCTSPAPELGWFEVTHAADDALFTDIESPFHTFVSHREQVTPDTPGLNVLASTDACDNHAFRVGSQRMWGVQFHSEIQPVEATRLIHDRAAKHPEQQIDVGMTLSRAVDSTDVARQIMCNFLAGSGVLAG